MGVYIVKLETPVGDRYLEWSDEWDGPSCFGMTLEEFREMYLERASRRAKRELDERLERVEALGTSVPNETPEEMMELNRAGPDETEISVDEIIDWYCVKKKDPRGLLK